MASRARSDTRARNDRTDRTDRTATAARGAATRSAPVPTTPPANSADGAKLVTVGPGQTPSVPFAPLGAAATPLGISAMAGGAVANASIPTGVWGATVGITTGTSGPLGDSAAVIPSTSAVAKKKFPIIPVAVGAGAGAIVLILAAVGIFCLVRRRKRARESFKMRTTNLRESFGIISPVNDKAMASEKAYPHYDYGAAAVQPPNDYAADDFVGTYAARGDDWERQTTFSSRNDYYKPQASSRFANSAQDRGYGMR